MAASKNFDDMMLMFLQDVYYAERQILKGLPKLAKAASHPKLREAFMLHRDETQQQVERLQKAFEVLGKRARGITCEAINGLIEESEEVVENFPEGPVRDGGLAACAQAIEHYEMARYGTMVAWAKAAGKQELVQLFEETLAEEKKTDQLLNQLANSELNKKMLQQAA